MYSVTSTTSTCLQIETNNKLNESMEVYIWNKSPFPVLLLSLILHFIL